MRGRLPIFLFVVVVVVLLVGLNAASYVRVGREPELEGSPDRSTSNAGPTGTRALYEFLEESGHKVMRWREEPAALTAAGEGERPATFVVVGRVRREFTEDDKRGLLKWVARGGRLVIIDRDAQHLLPAGERWGLNSSLTDYPEADARADDAESIVAGTQPVAPAQPTALTRGVERVALSRYAARLFPKGTGEAAPFVPAEGDGSDEEIEGNSDEEAGEPLIEGAQGPTSTPTPVPLIEGAEDQSSPSPSPSAAAPPRVVVPDEVYVEEGEPAASPGDAPTPEETPEAPPFFGPFGKEPEEKVETEAPTVHLADARGALLADYRRGEGRIVVLADPFVIANNGLARADNLQLAINVVTAGGGGLVAFDEYHQGRGATHNQLATYFTGTPVPAMFAQGCLLAALFFWSRGRRFARPIPALRPDRRSKLEFVAALAELQQRARAFDLAIENIYSRTRRALARYGGADSAAPRSDIAAAVSARSGVDRARLEELMRECEEAAGGAKVSARRALALAVQLRELERALGIRMRSREIKQAGRR